MLFDQLKGFYKHGSHRSECDIALLHADILVQRSAKNEIRAVDDAQAIQADKLFASIIELGREKEQKLTVYRNPLNKDVLLQTLSAGPKVLILNCHGQTRFVKDVKSGYQTI